MDIFDVRLLYFFGEQIFFLLKWMQFSVLSHTLKLV